MTVSVQYIPTNEAPHWWPSLGGFVNKAARRYKADYSLDDMRRAIGNGDAALFGVFHNLQPVAAIVTSEVVYPKRKIMLIELVGGDDMRVWFDDAVNKLTEYAVAAGYSAIQSTGRNGWSKWAKRVNFRQTSVTFEKDLTEGTQGQADGAE